MSDRGSCKVFSPNRFNPTKCQNCFKPKEGHPSGPTAHTGGKLQRGMTLPVARERNTSTVKTLVKEGFLSFGTVNTDGKSIQEWVKRWYKLYSSGELEEFQVEDGQVMKEKPVNVIILRDFIRLDDGNVEIGEENSIGLKSLRDGIYLKAVNKVEFENWWKELSTFVPSQMKRAYSASAANRPPVGNARPWLNKTYSSPLSSTSKTSTTKSPLSTQNESADSAQVDGLNSKIDKLQGEVNKIPKLEEEKRKLELEVNYWKEYVTNSNASKRSGGKPDLEKELNEARIQIISLQDKLNETEKQIRTSTLTVNKQNKELNESRANLEEANNIINMHKASINDLKSQLTQRKEGYEKTDGPPTKPDIKAINALVEERAAGALSPASDTSSDRGEASDFETKFLNLREKMKRIEKELFLKSKELEKANESRSKVAKYTRTLLQELEAKLNDTQRKMLEASERLSDTTMELELEREKRRRLESEREQIPLSRNSSVSSIISNQDQSSIESQSEPSQVGEIEVSNRYVEYYRSRFRESEASLLEKDKKLSEAETKFKELEIKYRNVLKQCRSLDDIQIKLSDATHKLSDRQLKIHELTREVEKLRGYERSYDRKSKELQLSTDKVKSLEEQLHELRNRLTVQEHELEGLKIREVVMKERLSELEEESSDEDGEDEDDDSRLERSIEAKERVERTVDLEAQVRLLVNEKENLNERIAELEEEVKNAMKNDKVDDKDESKGEEVGQNYDEEIHVLREKIKDLENKLIEEEDKFYTGISELKEKHRNEMETVRGSNRHDMQQFAKLKEDYQSLKSEMELKENERRSKDVERDEMLRERGDAAGEEQKNDYECVIANLKKQIEENNLKIEEGENVLKIKDEKMQALVKSAETLSHDLKEKSTLVEEMEEKLKDSEQVIKIKSNSIQQLQNLHEEKNTLLKNLENENAKLRDEVTSMEKQLFNESDEKFLIASEETQTSDADSGVLSSQGAEVELKEELSKTRELLRKSQALKAEYRNQLEESSRKYLESEQNAIDLAQELETKTGMEKDLREQIIGSQSKIEAMRSKLSDTQESLNAKFVELEKERNNISHLVDVTSSYIKELESSLTESREKIEELENIVEEGRVNNGKRMPPDGTSGKEREDSLSDQSDLDGGINDKDIEIERDRVNAENERLKTKLSSLESELAAVKSNFENEKQMLLESLRKQTEDTKEVRPVLDNEDGIDASQEPSSSLPSVNEEGPQKISEGDEFDETRLQEQINALEIELEEVRKTHKEEMKEKEENYSKSIEEYKEEMEKTISETVKALNGSISNQNTSELEDKIQELEKEKEELKIKYEDELEAEKEAHQIEMEETIRDMLTVTEVFKSGKYSAKEDSEEVDGHVTLWNCRRSSAASTESMDEIRKDYESKLAQKEKECQKDVETMKQDMLKVIDAIQQGGASAAILELTNKNEMLKRELDELSADFDVEREGLKMKIEKLESNNFFGLRRNEEMGSKIFQMQSELEEMERKHRLELEVYQNKENSDAIHEVVRVNEEMEKKLRKLEAELQASKEKSLEEMELMAMKVQEQKRTSINEMTDTVLNLEAIINEMKEKHEIDIKEFEERSREEKLEALDRLQERIDDLEEMLIQTKEDYEEKLSVQEEDQKKEMQDMKEELETKAEYYKALCEERQEDTKTVVSDSDLQEKYKALQMRFEELESEWESKLDGLKVQHKQEMEAKQKDFENQINEIRNEYEEKLKSCIKESARRHSVSSRKTESQKNKELSSKVMELEMALEEQQKEYQTEIDDYKQIIKNFESLVSELRDVPKTRDDGEEIGDSLRQGQATVQGVEKKPNNKVEELENQIKGFEKRIEYYKRKAERDEESENSRVSELQQEVHGLRKEMNEMTERHSQESIPGLESNSALRRRSDTSDRTGQRPFTRNRNNRWSDLHLTDVVFTNDGIEARRNTTDRESWKRWSDLQLKQDTKIFSQLKRDEAALSGSVARRKKLWEQSDEHRKIQRPLSSIRP